MENIIRVSIEELHALIQQIAQISRQLENAGNKTGSIPTSGVPDSFVLWSGSLSLPRSGVSVSEGNLTEMMSEYRKALNTYAHQVQRLATNLNHVASRFSETEKALARSLVDGLDGPLEMKSDFAQTTQQILDKIREFVNGRLRLDTDYAGDPVNMSTGNFVWSQSFLHLEHSACPMEFDITYNSIGSTEMGMGQGWTFEFGAYLSEEQNVNVHMGDGHTIVFEKAGDSYVHHQTDAVTLQRLEDGWQLDMEAGAFYHFSTEGRLDRIRTSDNRTLNLTYQSDGQLESVMSDLGQGYRFRYKDHLISSVEDTAGREMTLSYQKDLLTKITSQEQTFAFAYTESRLLKTITDNRGIQILENTYDELRRVVAQKMPDDIHVELRYDDENRRVEYVDPTGETVSYVHNNRFQTLQTSSPDGEEFMTYHPDGQRESTTNVLGQTTKYTYTPNGDLASVTNALGETTEFRYTPERNLEEVLAAGQRILYITYLNGLVSSMEDGTGQKTSYTYDAQGRMITRLLADGSCEKMAWDAQGNMTEQTTPWGVHTIYRHDAAGRVTEKRDDLGNVTQISYNALGYPVCVRNALGEETHYTYDRAGHVIGISYADGTKEAYTYTKNNQLSSYTNREGHMTRYNYNAMLQLTTTTLPNGAELKYEYDEHSKLCGFVDAMGNRQGLTYNALGQLVKRVLPDGGTYSFTYDPLHRITQVVDPVGVSTDFQYSPLGHIRSIRVNDREMVEIEYDAAGRVLSEREASGRETRYTYTSLGLVETISDQMGQVRNITYTTGGRVQTIKEMDGSSRTYTYDAAGRVASYTNQSGYRLTFTYDSLGRIIRQESSQGEVQSYRYHVSGQLAEIVNALGERMTYTYTPGGKLQSVTAPDGSKTTYSYDEMEQLVEINRHDFPDHTGGDHSRVTRFVRDKTGRVTERIHPNGDRIMYTYDACGRLESTTDEDGNRTEYAYWPDGQTRSIHYADGRNVQMHWNPFKQIDKLEDWLGITGVEYDAGGQPLKIVNPTGQALQYAYDLRGNVTQITYPDGQISTYTYDDASRLIQLSAGHTQIDYRYGENGKLHEKCMPDGQSVAYLYTPADQLAGIVMKDEAGTLDAYSYTYDAVGRRSGMTHCCRENADKPQHYTYRYSPAGDLSQVTLDGQILHAYAYDAFGNRTQKRTGSGETHYTYNEMDQLTGITGPDGITQSFKYDRRGNLCEMGNHSFVFDAQNRLTQYNHGTEQDTFLYDGFGSRIRRVHSDAENTSSTWDFVTNPLQISENLLTTIHEGRISDYFYDDLDLAMGISENGAVGYATDGAFSLLRAFHLTQGTSVPIRQDEFGIKTPDVPTALPFIFGGYREDGGPDGMLFAYRRNYMSSHGRYISPDCWEGDVFEPRSLNRYIYCGNDPLNLYDPTGLVWAWLAGGIVGAIKSTVVDLASDTFTYVTTGKWEGSVAKYVGSVTGGFVEGTVYVVSGGNAMIAGAAGGATRNFVSGTTQMIADGNVSWESFGKVMQSTVSGGVSGAATGFVFGKIDTKISGITKGRGSWDHVWRTQINTAARHNPFRNLSWKTIYKGAVTQGIIGGGYEKLKKMGRDWIEEKEDELIDYGLGLIAGGGVDLSKGSIIRMMDYISRLNGGRNSHLLCAV